MLDDHRGINRNYFKNYLKEEIKKKIDKIRAITDKRRKSFGFDGSLLKYVDNSRGSIVLTRGNFAEKDICGFVGNEVEVRVFFVSNETKKQQFIKELKEEVSTTLFISFYYEVKLLTFQYDDFFNDLSRTDKLELHIPREPEKIKDVQFNDPEEFLDKFEKMIMVDIFSENGDILLETDNYFWIGFFVSLILTIIYFFVFHQKKEKKEESSNKTVE